MERATVLVRPGLISKTVYRLHTGKGDIVTMKGVLFLACSLILICSSTAMAGDFDWTRDFNIRAEADPAGFTARLAARFQIGDERISAVLGVVDRPADGYMILRLAEMSGYPEGRVLEKYKGNKGKGWGVLAKSLGIKPGSKEFHALKRGDDLYPDRDNGKRKGKSKPK